MGDGETGTAGRCELEPLDDPDGDLREELGSGPDDVGGRVGDVQRAEWIRRRPGLGEEAVVGAEEDGLGPPRSQRGEELRFGGAAADDEIRGTQSPAVDDTQEGGGRGAWPESPPDRDELVLEREERVEDERRAACQAAGAGNVEVSGIADDDDVGVATARADEPKLGRCDGQRPTDPMSADGCLTFDDRDTGVPEGGDGVHVTRVPAVVRPEVERLHPAAIVSPTIEDDYRGSVVAALPTIDEALALVLARVQPLGSEPVVLEEAAGRVLAEDGRALVDLPPFPSSAMDGYAVRASDTPGPLSVVGTSAAGAPAPHALPAGGAIGISTGAVVPDGADAVVPVEHVVRTGSEIQAEAVSAGANVRGRGGDVRAGEVVLSRGTRLGAAHVGAAAAAGLATLVCARRPDVAVLATGSELRRPGDALAPGEIYESNAALLAVQCASAGAVVRRLGVVADSEAATLEALAAGLAADVLVTSGGVSGGVHDLVRGALEALGAAEVYRRVAVRPGRPVAFAVRGRTLAFGLPGNPVSSLVGFELFVRPALLALQGAPPGPRYLTGRLEGELLRNDARDDLVRARLRADDESVWLTPLDGQDSHMIVKAAAADALVRVPSGDGSLRRGDAVRYLPLSAA